VAQKIGTVFVRLNFVKYIDQFSNLCHCQNPEKICNNTITNDLITPQICQCSKATVENKITSETTNFKKLTTRNNVFIASERVLVLRLSLAFLVVVSFSIGYM